MADHTGKEVVVGFPGVKWDPKVRVQRFQYWPLKGVKGLDEIKGPYYIILSLSMGSLKE